MSDKITEQRAILQDIDNGLPFHVAGHYENLVHFQGAYNTPVQRWYPYREGYSTELVSSFLDTLRISGLVFDPFSGSGTTLLAARRKGLQSVGVEINPLSVLVSEVENEQYEQQDIISLRGLIESVKQSGRDGSNRNTLFELSDKMFNSDILQALLQFKESFAEIRNTKIKKLAQVAWLSVIDDVSDVKKEGNGLKYRYRKRTASGYEDIPKEEWENAHFPSDKFGFVRDRILERLSHSLEDIITYYGDSSNKPRIFHGDCLNFGKYFSDEIQFTFFSPPYCNCFDYFEIHKVELWLSEVVNNKEDIRNMRSQGFRSNTNSIVGKAINYHYPQLDALVSMFDADKLWNKQIPSVVMGYFDDMHTLLSNLFEQTVEGGYVGIVIGNSVYSNTVIPSDSITARIAEDVGFEVDGIHVARHLTTSSQQKEIMKPLNSFLRESIVLLRK